MLSGIVYLNDRLLAAGEARVSALDHGLLYGDGLFETLRVYGGRFFRLESHLDRLESGARRLGLPLPVPRTALRSALHETARANGLGDGAMRLTLTRGAGSPVPDPSVCGAGTLLITARPPASRSADGFAAGVRLGFGGPHPRLFVPALKTLCYLPFQQARLAARQRGHDEALLLHDGEVVEATASNVFLVEAAGLATPRLESGCLPGVTRAVVMELARRSLLPCREEAISEHRLAGAREIFLTNSLQEIVPVLELEGRPVADGSPGAITRQLQAAYRQRVSAGRNE